MAITERLLEWTERGLIPDALVRLGIRRLCRQRLAQVDLGDRVRNQAALESLISQFSQGPIAPLPEKANEQHYEVSAAFFDHVLGQRKKYSCCYFPDSQTSLNQAEEFALQQTCEHAELRDGQSILELGCGWGSLSLWMAEKFPHADITAVSNSNSQREFIEQRAQRLGLNRNLKVITCDMNDFDIDATFDRVVSVEMFEHMRNYRKLLAKVARWLKQDGKLFVHIFCHREFTYEFQDKGASDWMSRYFFSGGIMPGEGLFAHYAEDMTICQQWRWSGSHYHLTSEAWLKNMDSQRQSIMNILEVVYGRAEAKLWFQRWRVFFLAVSELFKMDNGQQWWVAHYLFEKTDKSMQQDSLATTSSAAQL